MNLPNKLTILRVCLIPLFLLFLLANPAGELSRLMALAIFFAASFTDFLDGYIARKYNLITNFGKFMDPLADKLLVASALIAFVELNEISAVTVIVIISREFIITGFRLVAAEAGVVIAAGFWGKIKTVAQMTLIVYMLAGLSGQLFAAFGGVLEALAVIFTVISALDYIYKNINVLKDGTGRTK